MKHNLLNPLRLLLVALCMLGIAAEGQNVVQDDFNFELNPATHTATCKGYNGSSDAPVMPSIINYEGEEYPVTFIGHYALTNKSFKTITLPETLLQIGEAAFMNSDKLESVLIPNSVGIIGVIAFQGCTSLKSIKLSENLKVISGGLFRDCQSLESIEIPNSINHFMESIENPGLDMETLMEDAMSNCQDPNFFYIGGLSFWGCTNLKSVILPKNLKNIPAWCFGKCTNLENIEMPENIEYIGFDAFEDCPLKSLDFPANITQWFNMPFNTMDNNAYFKSYHQNPAPSIDFYGQAWPGTLCVPKGMTGIYSNISDWNRFARIIEATPAELTSEWRTFCAYEDLDFSGVEGLEAYIAKEYQDGKVLMERIEQVPAGTGIVLKGTPGFYEIPYANQLEPVENLLVGLNYGERIAAEDEDGNCNLFFNDATEMASLFYGPGFDAERAPALNDEGDQPAFEPADGARLPYHRAYLQLPASEAGKTVEMVFDSLTGIDEVVAEPSTDGPIYNLQGQRVTNPGPGIYIQNGRKFIVR